MEPRAIKISASSLKYIAEDLESVDVSRLEVFSGAYLIIDDDSPYDFRIVNDVVFRSEYRFRSIEHPNRFCVIERHLKIGKENN